MKRFNSIKILIKCAILLSLLVSVVEAKNSFTLHMYKQTMKPYIVKGVKYYPTSVNIGDIFNGVASWYGKYFRGRYTASGERYNMYHFTAAHKTLPLNTLVRVINIKNKKSVTVRVNDRGPFVKKRHLDLSYAAAKKLGIIKQGITNIKMKVLSTHYNTKKRVVKRVAKVAKRNKGVKRKKCCVKVQVASFSTRKRVDKFIKNREIKKLSPKIIEIKRDDTILYKVIVSNFESHKEAKKFVKSGKFDGAYIINL